MTVLLDTSALLAVLDADDLNHERARETWADLIASGEPLLSNNYLIVETIALTQHRLGLDAVQAIHEAVLPMLEVEWLTEADHSLAMAAVLAANRRKLSLVDCEPDPVRWTH